MSENKDPSIKLFGKTIQLGSNIDDDTAISSRIEPSAAVSAINCDCQSTSSDKKSPCSKQNENRVNEDPTSEEPMNAEHEGDRSSISASEEPKTPTSKSTKEENPNSPTKVKVMTSSQDLSKNDQDHNDQASSNSDSTDQNPLKKPDKIIPCARCSSMDTKFCYFNNYNVNQPRYFCKNCQRYWTAGGSMRNVPVGAGRRKSKNSTPSHHRHLVIPGASHGMIQHVMRPDGTVLAFGVDNPIFKQSKPGEESPPNVFPNGFLRSENEKKIPIPFSNCNSISIEKNGDCNGGIEGSQVVPCYSYGWIPIPQQTAFSITSYSGSTHQWGENLGTPWNLNWVPTPSVNSDQSSTNSTSPNTTPLGKHSRESLTLMPSNSENKEFAKDKDLEDSRVVIPKTLRIDDPSETAKSSIWTSLRIKHDNIGSSSGRLAFFGGLQQAKGVPYERRIMNKNAEASSTVLQANPAAFSRSLSFHEVAQ